MRYFNYRIYLVSGCVIFHDRENRENNPTRRQRIRELYHNYLHMMADLNKPLFKQWSYLTLSHGWRCLRDYRDWQVNSVVLFKLLFSVGKLWCSRRRNRLGGMSYFTLKTKQETKDSGK